MPGPASPGPAGNRRSVHDERRGGVVVPGVLGHGLIIPLVLAGPGVHGNDAVREERIARATHGGIPRAGGRGAEEHAAGNGVVADSLPDRTAAHLGPAVGPGGGGEFEFRCLEALGRVARHGPEAPHFFAGLGVERHQRTPGAGGAGVAGEDHAAPGPRRRTDVCADAFARIADGRLPELRRRGGIDGDQHAITAADEDATVPHRDAAAETRAIGVAETHVQRHVGI